MMTTEKEISNHKELWGDMENIGKWDDLEKYTHGHPLAYMPCITITEAGSLSLKLSFTRVAKLKEEGMSYVILYYSRSLNAIVMKFSQLATETSCNKFTLNKSGTATIVVRPFLKHYNITQVGNHRVYSETIHRHGECWVIYLDRQEK